MSSSGAALARAISDGLDRLESADEPLAGLQRRCGGEMPGTIAIPALLEIVRKARRYSFKLARTLRAQDGAHAITAWVEVEPRGDEREGCAIAVRSWRAEPLAAENSDLAEARRDEIDRAVAELSAQLDASQRVLSVDSEAADLAALHKTMRTGKGQPWTGFVTLEGHDHSKPLHWRLLDGARLTVAGSQRTWRARLLPQGVPGADPAGFELLLVATEPLASALPPPFAGEEELPGSAQSGAQPGTIGRDIAPALRQPIARIIANAETIRTRLAGPLADEYASYAADIAIAGQHLLGLLDDLSDLEVVESDDFTTAPDRIDLAEVARQAAGILGVRARERGIAIDAPKAGESVPVIAEFRRVLQILLNLVGNAIRYAPSNSQIWIRLEEDGSERGRVIVADQGPGLSEQDQTRVFEKFERLGRSGDGGSGLGLYISRRLARAMGGELSVESAPGQGARFIVELPGDPAASLPIAAEAGR